MLSIIITHHQTPVLLKICLKSLLENLVSFEHEIIVADSQAEIETQDLIKEKFPSVQFVSFEKNVGYAKIVNSGLKKAQGDYFLIINADIIVTPGAIEGLLSFLKDNPQAGLVAPRLLTFSNLIQSSCFRFPNLGAILARRTFLSRSKWGRQKIDDFLMKQEDFSFPRPVDWVQGSAMLVRGSALKEVGLLDERFFMYLEDTDWCRRFWQKGYQVVYLPTSQMYHYYYRISKKWGAFLDVLLNKYTRLHLMSAFKYFWKWS